MDLLKLKSYFSSICTDEDLIREVHKIGNKGNPGLLKEMKLLCIELGSVKNFLDDENLKVKDEFLNKLWDKVDTSNKLQLELLAFIAFSDIKLDMKMLCNILSIDESEFYQTINNLSFIENTKISIEYHSIALKKYAEKKLSKLEDNVNYKLIEYCEKNQELDINSRFNLPALYRKAKAWDKITKFFSIEGFMHFLEKYQTMGKIKKIISDGYDASSQSNNEFNEARLRFALHKSSAMDIERNILLESEIEARISLGDYEYALILANSALLKEERLKLLSIIAKEKKIKHKIIDKNLNDQIRNLCNDIDLNKNTKSIFEISILLVYSNFQLAIELVEKITDNTASNNSLDHAFSYLTLFANEINKESKSQIADVDILSTKIQDKEIKDITEAFRFLSEEYNAEEILEKVEVLSNFNQKLFLLRNWILNHKNNNEIGTVILFLLEEIVNTSGENVPNATTLSDIATPLPSIKDKKEIEHLISLFDAHKDTIDKPTKDYVKLQLILAEALKPFNFETAKDRIFDIFVFIDDLFDLSVKTDCLCLLWLWLIKNDEEKKIEDSISKHLKIQEQIEENIEQLLNKTALHFKMVESIILTMITIDSDFVFKVITNLNTIERQDFAFKSAIEDYIRNVSFEKFEYQTIKQYYNSINNIEFREDILLEVIDRFHNNKSDIKLHISKLIKFQNEFLSISDIKRRCYVFVHLIKVLSTNRKLYEKEISELLNQLMSSWESVNNQWHKILIGFLIARDIEDYSNEEARKYLNLSFDLKNEDPFSSNSLINIYTSSIRLAIRAFCGLILIRNDIDAELSELKNAIDSVNSVGEKMLLWSEVLLRIFSNNKKDLFEKVYNENLKPLLSDWNFDLTDPYKIGIITQISPVIYCMDHSLFFSDYLSNLSNNSKNQAIFNVCDFIITRLTLSDPLSEKYNLLKLDHSEINNLCILVEKSTDDNFIWRYIGKIVDHIKENRSKITGEQTNNLRVKIKSIIDKKLPSKNGIKHNGYKILSNSELLLLDNYNKQKWEKLQKEIELLPNLSDKAFCYIALAQNLNLVDRNKKDVVELIDKTFDCIKLIPSFYEKNHRIEGTLQICSKIDRGKFNKHIKTAFTDLLSLKDSNIVSMRNLIDIAQKFDKKLAESFVTLLDKDKAREKLKLHFTKRIESKNKVDEAKNKYNKISELSTIQSMSLFNKSLEELNSNTRVSTNISNTFEILNKASSIPLSSSIKGYCYFIQNAIKKFEVNKKNPEVLSNIFRATIENTRLIQILSCDNIDKMKNLNRHSSINLKQNNPIFGPGENSEAIEYLKNWFLKNITNRLYIIDPNFTENDLQLIQLIQEINPECHVTILTSKESRNNCHIDSKTTKSINKEKYIQKWRSISAEPPLNTTVKIVWNKENNKSPFHDRYYITENPDKGLSIGTSFNGLGKKDSQINELTEDALSEAKKNIISKYIFREVNRVGNINLKYERFDLNE